MESKELRQLYNEMRAKEMKPKKLALILHLDNGSKYLDGQKISEIDYLAMKMDSRLKVIDLGKKPNNKRK